MRKRTRPYYVGLFVLACLVLLVGSLIWVGATRFLGERRTYVAFFDESVAGLDEKARVSYRGVRVGHVDEIRLAPDGRLIAVEMKLLPEFQLEEEMVATIATEGLTGRRYVEIDLAPPEVRAESPRLTFEPEHPVIPSRPSAFTRVERGLAEIVEEIESADLHGLVTEWKGAGRELKDILGDPALRRTIADLQEATGGLARIADRFSGPEFQEELTGAIRELRTTWSQAGRDLDALVSDPALRRTIARLDASSEHLRSVLAGIDGAATPQEWEATFRDLSTAAAAARQASESLAVQLSQVPPDSLARVVEQMESAASSVGGSFSTWGDKGDRLLVSLETSVRRVNQLVSQLEVLVRNLRSEPGRIFSRPERSEPFER